MGLGLGPCVAPCTLSLETEPSHTDHALAAASCASCPSSPRSRRPYAAMKPPACSSSGIAALLQLGRGLGLATARARARLSYG